MALEIREPFPQTSVYSPPLQTLRPEVPIPSAQHSSTPKELTVYGSIISRKVKVKIGKAIPVTGVGGP
jgi:hypothetical protein